MAEAADSRSRYIRSTKANCPDAEGDGGDAFRIGGRAGWVRIRRDTTVPQTDGRTQAPRTHTTPRRYPQDQLERGDIALGHARIQVLGQGHTPRIQALPAQLEHGIVEVNVRPLRTCLHLGQDLLCLLQELGTGLSAVAAAGQDGNALQHAGSRLSVQGHVAPRHLQRGGGKGVRGMPL